MGGGGGRWQHPWQHRATPTRHPPLPPFPAPRATPRRRLQSGLDLLAGCVRDNVEAGVLEPTISKLKILQFATEAAITILRIDDLIRLEPEQEEGGEEY